MLNAWAPGGPPEEPSNPNSDGHLSLFEFASSVSAWLQLLTIGASRRSIQYFADPLVKLILVDRALDVGALAFLDKGAVEDAANYAIPPDEN